MARTLVGTVSALERFEFGKTLAALTRGDVAIALLDSLDRVWPDRYLETVAVERGARVKVATSLSDAMGWLSDDA